MTDVEITAEQKSLAGKYLTFAISQERYGMEILKVQEIIGVPRVTPVPRCPKYIKGVINLRGKIIPVIELRRKFGLESVPYNEHTCIIVANLTINNQIIAIGVTVDTVLEVIDFSISEIEPCPNYGTHLDSSFILGMGKRENNLNILLDIEKILSTSEKAVLSQGVA